MRLVLWLLSLGLLSSCGSEDSTKRELPASRGGDWLQLDPSFADSSPISNAEASDHSVPAWARISKGQLAIAGKEKVPPAFENSIGMRFVIVPPGRFLMGAASDDAEKDPSEGPQHEVLLTQAIHMAIYEVTNDQYQKFRDSHNSGKWGKVNMNGLSNPVVQISFSDARDYASWLSDLDPEYEYRLPTEAEWEYACRAGTTTSRYWGGDPEALSTHCNFLDALGQELTGLPGDAVSEDGFPATAPVGSYPANPWGLYDMLGNVLEWCGDWYEARYEIASKVDPTGPPSGVKRVNRGGSFAMGADVARAAFRGFGDPRIATDFCGFRLVARRRQAK